MADTLDSFDILLDENEDGSDPHGFLVAWDAGEDACVLQIDEQTVPAQVVGDQEDENYGFRDLQDTWRASFSNFSGGEGQLRRDVSGGSLSKYHESRFVDISVEGSLRLHHDLRLLTDSANFPVNNYLASSSTAIEWQGYVACICSPYNTALDQHHRQIGLFDPQAPTAYWKWIGQVTDPLTAACDAVALASDGEKLYVLYANGDSTQAVHQGLWSYTTDDIYTTADIGSEVLNGTQLSNTTTVKTVTDMVFCGGWLYLSAATSDGAKLGYYSDAAADFVALSPDGLITPTMTCFGLAAVGTWVYWGLTSGGRSWVYAAQYDASAGLKHFQQFVELPTGFVGSSLIPYLGNLYIGGSYIAEDADAAQGAVFLANQNGISRLCTIGDDPNETDDPGADVNRNRVIAGYGYDHFIYLLTERSLYRWDVRDGGLNHIADPGTFSVSSGDPGSLLSIPWNTTYSYWQDPAYTNDEPCGVEEPQLDGSTYSGRWEDDVITYYDTEGALQFVRYKSDTRDLNGDNVYSEWDTDGTTFGNFASGGVVEFEVKNIREDAFGLGITTAGGGTGATRDHAILQLRGRTSSDNISVYYLNSSGVVTFLCDVSGRDTVHRFFFSADNTTKLAKLWCDDVFLGQWTMRRQSFAPLPDPGFAYCYGSFFLGSYSGITRDWQVSLRYMRWAVGQGYDPTWTTSSGVVASGSFTVIAGSPYIVSAPATGTKGLMAFDFSARAESGWLETSETALRMPTVAKTATTLEVYHDATDSESTITVSVYVDGDYAGQVVIGASDESRLSQAQMNKKGHRLKCLIALTGNAVVYGTSVSFTPIDHSFYQLRLDLREERRDNYGHDVLLADKVAWLLGIADSKKILWLTTPYERVRVRAALLSFSGRSPQLDSHVDVQGIATVRFKRLPT